MVLLKEIAADLQKIRSRHAFPALH